MKYYAGSFLTVLLSRFAFSTVAAATCDSRLGSDILASDCVEALSDMRRFMELTMGRPEPMSFNRNARNGPADLPKGFTSLASCAFAVDIAGSFDGIPIRYDWKDHLRNIENLINHCVTGYYPGTGGSAVVSGFRYILVNPRQDGLKLPECFRPVLPDKSDVLQCVMRENTFPAPQPPLGTSSTRGANHPAPTDQLLLTARESPPAGAQTPPGGTDSGPDNMGAAGTSGGSTAVRGFGAGERPAAGAGGMSAAERESESDTTESNRRNGGPAIANNQFTTGNPQLRSGNGEHQPVALVWKSKQGDEPWTDWSGSKDWYNSNGYLRVAMASQAKSFPDPPIPDMVNKEIFIGAPKAKMHDCTPVSGIWVYDGNSWLSERYLLELNRRVLELNRRPNHKEVPSEKLSVFRLDIQLGSPKNQGAKMGILESSLLEDGYWIVIRGLTPAPILPFPEQLLLAAEQVAAEQPAAEPSNLRVTRSRNNNKKQKVIKSAAKGKVDGGNARAFYGAQA